mmetsp:Transcript_14363/g.45290  ORF Transcript_14363/g.45290 Transcript_14363/m.45290 type:complete len:241 (+) Transcript_14363:308-1030(+)
MFLDVEPDGFGPGLAVLEEEVGGDLGDGPDAGVDLLVEFSRVPGGSLGDEAEAIGVGASAFDEVLDQRPVAAAAEAVVVEPGGVVDLGVGMDGEDAGGLFRRVVGADGAEVNVVSRRRRRAADPERLHHKLRGVQLLEVAHDEARPPPHEDPARRRARVEHQDDRQQVLSSLLGETRRNVRRQAHPPQRRLSQPAARAPEEKFLAPQQHAPALHPPAASRPHRALLCAPRRAHALQPARD